MTERQFNKAACELIERIQDLETEKVLLEYALKGLREDYIKEQAEKFKKNVAYLNQKIAGENDGNN